MLSIWYLWGILFLGNTVKILEILKSECPRSFFFQNVCWQNSCLLFLVVVDLCCWNHVSKVLPRRTFSSPPLCISWYPCSLLSPWMIPTEKVLVQDPSPPPWVHGHSWSSQPIPAPHPWLHLRESWILMSLGWPWAGRCTQVPVGCLGWELLQSSIRCWAQEHLDHSLVPLFQNPQRSPRVGAVTRTCKHLDMSKTA